MSDRYIVPCPVCDKDITFMNDEVEECPSCNNKITLLLKAVVVEKEECPECHGRGVIEVRDGNHTHEYECHRCNGKGYIHRKIEKEEC